MRPLQTKVALVGCGGTPEDGQFVSSVVPLGVTGVRSDLCGTGFATHELFVAKCAGPDLNRRKKCSLTCVRCAFLPGLKSVLLFAHFARSCAGPDLNRRTPTG